jgi:hemolysin D
MKNCLHAAKLTNTYGTSKQVTSKLQAQGQKGRKTEIEFLPGRRRHRARPAAEVRAHHPARAVAGLRCFILWACLSPVEKIVVAHGRLVNPLPNIVVQPLETSIIQSIDVRVGQVVKKGEVLADARSDLYPADERSCACGSQPGHPGRQPAAPNWPASRSAAAGSATPTALLQAQLSERAQGQLRGAEDQDGPEHRPPARRLETNKHDQSILAQRVKSLREVEACRSN